MASTPDAATARASSTVATMATTLIPCARQRATRSGPGSPSPTLKTAGRSSRIISICAGMRSGMAAGRAACAGQPELGAEPVEHPLHGGQPLVGDARRIRGRAELRVKPQVDAERPVRPLAHLADPGPQLLGRDARPARIPRPPARDTSATRSGPATFAMPDWMIGYSIPSRSHSAVRRTSRIWASLSGSPRLQTLGAWLAVSAGERAGERPERDQRQADAQDDGPRPEVGDQDEARSGRRRPGCRRSTPRTRGPRPSRLRRDRPARA